MFKSRTAKRFRAIAAALAITFIANYAISFAAYTSDTSVEVTTKLLGSGPTPPDDIPKPRALESGPTPPDDIPKPLAFGGSGPTPPDDIPKP
ncbi:MAG: hypothetical protein WEE20_12060 [Bacteroidota bacterium]